MFTELQAWGAPAKGAGNAAFSTPKPNDWGRGQPCKPMKQWRFIEAMALSEAEAALRCTAQTAVAALQKLQESELYTAAAKEPFVRRVQLYMSPSVLSRACLGESRRQR